MVLKDERKGLAQSPAAFAFQETRVPRLWGFGLESLLVIFLGGCMTRSIRYRVYLLCAASLICLPLQAQQAAPAPRKQLTAELEVIAETLCVDEDQEICMCEATQQATAAFSGLAAAMGPAGAKITAAMCRSACMKAGKDSHMCRAACGLLKNATCCGLKGLWEHCVRHGQRHYAEALMASCMNLCGSTCVI